MVSLVFYNKERSMKKFSKCDSVNSLAGRYDLKLYIKQILTSFSCFLTSCLCRLLGTVACIDYV